MTFGGWSIDRELFDFLVERVPSNGLLVELGSGVTSPKLAEHFRLVSYEHDPRWLRPDRSPKWSQHYAPLVAGWYQRSSFVTLPKSYDVLLVDGPPGGEARLRMLNHLDLFDWTAMVVVDDVHRRHEKDLVKKLVEHIRITRPCEPRVVRSNQKSFAVL